MTKAQKFDLVENVLSLIQIEYDLAESDELRDYWKGHFFRLVSGTRKIEATRKQKKYFTFYPF